MTSLAIAVFSTLIVIAFLPPLERIASALERIAKAVEEESRK
jgi:hypothetical protein